MIFQLEQRHIDQGVPCHCDECPVVLCVAETTGAKKVYLVAGVITIDNFRVAIPPVVLKWVRSFDWRGRGVVTPMTFELPYP